MSWPSGVEEIPRRVHHTVRVRTATDRFAPGGRGVMLGETPRRIAMNEQEMQQHLSHIATQWSVLRQAHRGDETEAARARQVLMQRYCGAVYRYLLRAVRDPAVAEDLTQEFALRFVQGCFGHADPAQGRFRNYVKGALFRLVQDHRRSAVKAPKAVSLEDDAPVTDPHDEAAERDFRESWRQELLSRAWDDLQEVQKQTGQPYFDVLRLR